jgi:hypothetical protein
MQPSRAPKRGLCRRAPPGAARAKIVAVAADNSPSLAVSVQSASPAECQLVEEVLAGSFLDELPARLIGDKACDSDPLDAKLVEEYGIELIAPNRRGRKRSTQDSRQLRRYRKRWKVERLFAWMHNFRRLVYPMGMPHRELSRLRPLGLPPPAAQIPIKTPSLSELQLTGWGRAIQANVAASKVNVSGTTRGSPARKRAIKVAVPTVQVITTAP